MMRFMLLGCVLLTAFGCQSPGATHVTAKQEASQRWNRVRAQVKARLASEQLAMGSTQNAAHEIAEARRLDPENVNHQLVQARVLLAEGMVEAADVLLAEVANGESASAEVAYLRGVVAQQQMRWPAALEHFLVAVDRDPSDVVNLTAAVQVLLQLDQAASAEALLGLHARQHEWTPTFQVALAECQEQRGNWVAAAQAWQRVLSHTSDQITLERLALALERAGRCREAVLTLEAALEDVPRDQQDRILLNLARCDAELEDYQTARRRLQRILARQPGHPGALQALAEVLVGQGDFGEALTMALTVLERDPQNVPMLELGAVVAHRLEEAALATALAQRLLAADPDSPVGLTLLAR